MDIGDDVRGLRVGDRVALEPGVPCWANPASRYLPLKVQRWELLLAWVDVPCRA